MKKNLVLKLIKKVVKENPNIIAIKKDKINITYKKFWEDCNKFSKIILSTKKKPIVSILGTHQYFDYVCLFGTLLSGGTYVPINNQLPLSKIKKIISLSKSNFLCSAKINYKNLKYITTISEKDFIKGKNLFLKKQTKQNKYNLAYIIFTSGSTGEPKGVKITRENLDAYTKWLVGKLAIKKGSITSQLPNIGFDLSVADIYGSICSGGTLVLPSNYDKIFPGEYINHNKISHLVCVPSLINVIKNSGQLKQNYLKSLKKVFFCGEPLLAEHLSSLFKANKNIKVINAYGPTEATVSCTSIDLNKKNYRFYSKYSMSIGRPITGTKIYLHKNNKISLSEGEIIISGKQVAEGYVKNYLENEKKFVMFKNKKSFFTGDTGFYHNKNLYFKGRIDNQIKIKGFRVELNEISFFMRKLGFKNNFSIFTKNRIISIIQGKKINRLNIIKKLKKLLPHYMIPSDFIFVKKIPFNDNGKVDQRKLIDIFNEKK